ncbi:hypothetical protein JCM10207_001761 [Rhodosporidiobolus poonsookiae]
MSYAADLSASLASSLDRIAPQLQHPDSPSPSPTLNTLQAGNDDDKDNAVQTRQHQLRTLLNKLRPTSHASPSGLSKPHPAANLSPSQLAQLVDAAFPPFQGNAATPLTPQTETVELVAIAQLAVATYGVVLRILMDEASRLAEMDDWWSTVESDPWRTSLYLVQTTPSRAFSLGTVATSRLHQLTRSSFHSPPSLFHLETWRVALPPSLFLTSLFPHLQESSGLPSLREINESETGGTVDIPSPTSISLASASRLGRRTARSLVFLTLSPLALTRQEIAHQRTQIRKTRDELATQIGELTLAASAPVPEDEQEQDQPRGSHLGLRGKKFAARPPTLARLFSPSSSLSSGAPPTVSDIRAATWSTLTHLDYTLCTSSLLSGSGGPRITSSTPPAVPADLAHALSFLLTRTLPLHERAFSSRARAVSPPSALARAWPFALAVPLGVYAAGRVVYTNKDSLKRLARETVETVRAFVVDWVVEPVRKILETVRGGETVGLMGRESLRSDLDSLERMVVDFARDEYKLGPDELAALSDKVRSGDLTPVLKAWEKEIKSPIRSAVGGSLIRTLLIQVQKVKVDVALAMDGIEKMLKSQQLTFAFVGVAPSMLVLALFGRWARGMVRSEGGGRGRREMARRGWLTLRQLDLLLSPPRTAHSSHLTHPHPSPALTQGLILLSLSHLRSYARSRAFPSRDTQLRAAFLEDIRAVEDDAAQAGTGERKVLVGRLWRWSGVLGWEGEVGGRK